MLEVIESDRICSRVPHVTTMEGKGICDAPTSEQCIRLIDATAFSEHTILNLTCNFVET